MKKRILIYASIAEVVIIIALALYISQGKKSAKIHINYLKGEDQIYPKVDGLKFFYEPKPNTIDVIQLMWDNKNGPKNPVYKINLDGFNQIENFPATKPKDVFRIITLGDSFTFGQNVNTEDNYPSKLQELLNKSCKNKFQVSNLGVGGYDFQYSVERYKLRGQKYNPDLIIWLMVNGDFSRMDEHLLPELYTLQKAGEKLTNAEVVQYSLWHKAAEIIINELGEQNILDNQMTFISSLSKYFTKKILLTTFQSTNQKYKDLLVKISNWNPSYLVFDSLQDTGKINAEYLPDGHPSPVGHKRIAENIFSYLTKNKIIPCNN